MSFRMIQVFQIQIIEKFHFYLTKLREWNSSLVVIPILVE